MLTLRPFWRYYGGKWRNAPHYPAPMFGTIVEPFAGAAGYALRHHRRDVLLIDKNPIIAGLWRYLIDATPDDIRSLPDIPDGGTVDDMDAPQAARWLAGFWCNDAVAAPCKRPSKWASRGANVHNWGGWNARSRERVASQVAHIKHWRVLECAYSDAPDVEATWFVDPPYRGRAGRHYPHQPDSFEALGTWCQARRGQVIVCEQDGADWLPFEAMKTFRSATGKDRPSETVEVLWTNGPRAGLLFGGGA